MSMLVILVVYNFVKITQLALLAYVAQLQDMIEVHYYIGALNII